MPPAPSMQLDARTLEGKTRLEADVCIVGAGPAGITLARELAASGRSVILLESGGPGADADAQLLNDGPVIGSRYDGLRASRHRQVGGTAHLWNTCINGCPGAKYVPLDHADFQERGDVPN